MIEKSDKLYASCWNKTSSTAHEHQYFKKTHECYQMPAYLVSVLSLELQVFSWYRFFSTSGTLS